MIIKNISITDFRNYGRLDTDVGPSVNIVYGNNAQGKTNLIEAINVCSCTTSHRTGRDKDLIRQGCSEYRIEMKCFDEEYNSDITLTAAFYDEGSKNAPGKTPARVLLHNGMKMERISDYVGLCNTVIFAPEDLNIIKGAPSCRRKFLNMLIIKVSPSYCDLLGRTNRLINQKTACIKNYKGNADNIKNEEMDFWDYSLADLSADLLIMRMRYVYLLSEAASGHHSVISDGKERLTVEYSSISGVNDLFTRFFDDTGRLDDFKEGRLREADMAELKRSLSELLINRFRSSRRYDVEKGICSTGVHRDDLDIKLNGMVMKTFCSQGQQRSAALSMKLAELQIVTDQTGSSPILLLDDVFSELDQSRRLGLLAGMHKSQIFITCTDRTYIENELAGFLIDDVKPTYIRVENGSVTVEN